MIESKAIICDLDGTLFNDHHRRHDDAGVWEAKHYHKFYERMDQDERVEAIHDIICMNLAIRRKIIFMTGRPENYRERTINALERKCGLTHTQYMLFMRPKDNFVIKDCEMKEGWYNEIKDTYEVMYVLEDRQRVVDMWRRIGLTCLQPQPGNF